MDPTAAWNRMLDESLPNDDRIEAARDLRDWLSKGGFPPRTGVSFGGNTAARFYIDRKIDETLALPICELADEECFGKIVGGLCFRHTEDDGGRETGPDFDEYIASGGTVSGWEMLH